MLAMIHGKSEKNPVNWRFFAAFALGRSMIEAMVYPWYTRRKRREQRENNFSY